MVSKPREPKKDKFVAVAPPIKQEIAAEHTAEHTAEHKVERRAANGLKEAWVIGGPKSGIGCLCGVNRCGEVMSAHFCSKIGWGYDTKDGCMFVYVVSCHVVILFCCEKIISVDYANGER